MYLLHIGNDIILRKENIIGIFNLEKLKSKKEFLNIYNKMVEEKKVIKLSQNQEKSLIIIQKNKEIIWYISNINSRTLEKRASHENIKI